MAGLFLFTIACSSTNTTTIPPDESIPDLEENTVSDPETQTVPSDTVSPEDKRREELTTLYKEELNDQYQADANGLINFYILAQQRFFSGNYQNALILINRAAAIKENADVLALKGSIYLGLGQTDNFLANWRQALEMDPEVPIPSIPYVVQQLQLNGLLDENLQKAF